LIEHNVDAATPKALSKGADALSLLFIRLPIADEDL